MCWGHLGFSEAGVGRLRCWWNGLSSICKWSDCSAGVNNARQVRYIYIYGKGAVLGQFPEARPNPQHLLLSGSHQSSLSGFLMWRRPWSKPRWVPIFPRTPACWCVFDEGLYWRPCWNLALWCQSAPFGRGVDICHGRWWVAVTHKNACCGGHGSLVVGFQGHLGVLVYVNTKCVQTIYRLHRSAKLVCSWMRPILSLSWRLVKSKLQPRVKAVFHWSVFAWTDVWRQEQVHLRAHEGGGLGFHLVLRP